MDRRSISDRIKAILTVLRRGGGKRILKESKNEMRHVVQNDNQKPVPMRVLSLMAIVKEMTRAAKHDF
jgi:hypothetical protein